jgi:hypothetical protein
MDFVIALHFEKWNGTILTTYFGKIKGIRQSGNHLRKNENIIHIQTDSIEPYIKLSALGHQCAYHSEEHFRRSIEVPQQ